MVVPRPRGLPPPMTLLPPPCRSRRPHRRTPTPSGPRTRSRRTCPRMSLAGPSRTRQPPHRRMLVSLSFPRMSRAGRPSTRHKSARRRAANVTAATRGPRSSLTLAQPPLLFRPLSRSSRLSRRSPRHARRRLRRRPLDRSPRPGRSPHSPSPRGPTTRVKVPRPPNPPRPIGLHPRRLLVGRAPRTPLQGPPARPANSRPRKRVGAGVIAEGQPGGTAEISSPNRWRARNLGHSRGNGPAPHQQAD